MLYERKGDMKENGCPVKAGSASPHQSSWDGMVGMRDPAGTGFGGYEATGINDPGTPECPSREAGPSLLVPRPLPR
jgi:hypothetical protein